MTRLLQNLYFNSFAYLDQKDPYIYLTEFYDIYGTLGAPEEVVDVLFMILFT